MTEEETAEALGIGLRTAKRDWAKAKIGSTKVGRSGARVTSVVAHHDRFHRVDTIFDAALDLPPDEQTAFIDRECGGDAALRAEVLELVRAYHRSDSVLESPAARSPRRCSTPRRRSPAGARAHRPFRVVREIGRGGMGRVFLGERADGQFEQRVAIKLIQHGAPGVLRRFVEERRILALLEHPGIARLWTAASPTAACRTSRWSSSRASRSTAYCERRGLTLDQRLALFAGCATRWRTRTSTSSSIATSSRRTSSSRRTGR